PDMSPRAKATMSDMDSFKKKYGNEYVSKVYRGAELQVWFTAKSRDYSISESSSQNLAAELSYALGASGAANASRKAEAQEFLKHVEFEVRIYSKGTGAL